MKSTLISLSNPIWSNAEHTSIDCIITTSQFGDEELPFTAALNDVEEHGRVLFNRIISGDFGVIAEYVTPIEQESPTPSSGDIPTEIL